MVKMSTMLSRTIIDYRRSFAAFFILVWHTRVSFTAPTTSITSRVTEPSPSTLRTTPPQSTNSQKSASSPEIVPSQIAPFNCPTLNNDVENSLTTKMPAPTTVTKANPNNELVAMEIRIPLIQDITNSVLKKKISLGIVASYRKGKQVNNRRKKRSIYRKLSTRKLRKRKVVESERGLSLGFSKVETVKATLKRVLIRVKRQTRDITAEIVLLQRRSQTSEKVDLQFSVHMGDGLVPAEDVIKELNKLTFDELNSTLGFTVLRGPSLPSKDKPTKSSQNQEEISQRALLSAILIPVIVLVVLLPCLLMDTKCISLKCLLRKKHSHAKPEEIDGQKDKNGPIPNPSLKTHAKRKTNVKTKVTISPPVPSASPISSILAQAKRQQTNGTATSTVKPSLAQLILQNAREMEEKEKEQNQEEQTVKENEKVSEIEASDGTERRKEENDEAKTTGQKEEETKKEDEKSIVRNDEKLVERKKTLRSQMAKSILRQAKELKVNDNTTEEKMDNTTEKKQIKQVNKMKRKDRKIQPEQHQGAVVEMFTNVSEKQLVSSMLTRPTITRAWTWDDVTRPKKAILLEEIDDKDKDEPDEFESMARAERNRNKQLQKSKSDLPLEEIKKAKKQLKQKHRDEKKVRNRERIENMEPSMDFLRKKHMRRTRWRRNSIAPIDDEDDYSVTTDNSLTNEEYPRMVISPPIAITALDAGVTQVTQHCGHSNTTQNSDNNNVTQYSGHDIVTQYSGHDIVKQEVDIKQEAKGIIMPEINNFADKSTKSSTKNLNVMRNNESMHDVTVDMRHSVTQDNDTKQHVTQQNVHEVTQATLLKDVTQEEENIQIVTLQPSWDHSTVTQQSVTLNNKQYDNNSSLGHLKKKLKHNEKRSNVKITQLFNQDVTQETQQSKLQNDKKGSLKSQSIVTKQSNNGVTRGALQHHANVTQRERIKLTPEEETEIEKKAKELVMKALARVFSE